MVNGIVSYTEGEIRMKTYLPEGREDCRHCGFCWYLDAFGVYRCRLTDAYIEKAELGQRNEACPIDIGGTQNETL